MLCYPNGPALPVPDLSVSHTAGASSLSRSEQDEGNQVFDDVHKAMRLPCRNVDDGSRTNLRAGLVGRQRATTAQYDVDLVLGVRFLSVEAP